MILIQLDPIAFSKIVVIRLKLNSLEIILTINLSQWNFYTSWRFVRKMAQNARSPNLGQCSEILRDPGRQPGHPSVSRRKWFPSRFGNYAFGMGQRSRGGSGPKVKKKSISKIIHEKALSFCPTIVVFFSIEATNVRRWLCYQNNPDFLIWCLK